MSEETTDSNKMTVEGYRHNYLVVVHNNLAHLVTEVGDLISRGWECQGGISAAFATRDPPDNIVWFYQAMIKR